MARKKKASKKGGKPSILSVARKAKSARGRKPSRRASRRGRYAK
jgi:hypothetical protein